MNRASVSFASSPAPGQARVIRWIWSAVAGSPGPATECGSPQVWRHCHQVPPSPRRSSSDAYRVATAKVSGSMSQKPYSPIHSAASSSSAPVS